MFEVLEPDYYYKDIFSVDFDRLKDIGIRGIICDIDNTIVPYHKKELIQDVLDWFETMKKEGFKICLLSNGMDKRVEFFSNKLDLPAIGQAVKPRKKAYFNAINILNLHNSQIAVIGDQIFTDVYGGNRIGLKTILVDPMDNKEFILTKFVRKIEKFVYKRKSV